MTPAKLQSGTGSDWVWQTWSPTYTNITVGNGTVTAKYIQIGKTVHFKYDLLFGSTTTIGTNPTTVSLPVTATSESINLYPLGWAVMRDAGSSTYYGIVNQSTTTTMNIDRMITESGTNPVALKDSGSPISDTQPFTWTTNDRLIMTGTYEAA